TASALIDSMPMAIFCRQAPPASNILARRFGRCAKTLNCFEFMRFGVDARGCCGENPPRLSRCEAFAFGASRPGVCLKHGSFYERRQFPARTKRFPLPLHLFG